MSSDDMERKILQDCPVCGGSLKATVLKCTRCSTKIEGQFDPPQSRIFSLPRKDLEFVELFVRVRGNIKEMEKALGVSYPTVRGRLDAVISRLGYAGKQRTMDPEMRSRILDQLEKGEISAAEATRLIREQEGKNNGE